jgi:hypothetical protein
MRNRVSSFIVILLLCIGNYASYSQDKQPYYMQGEVSIFSDTGDFKYAGVNITFCNNTEKDIKKIVLILFLSDFDDSSTFSGNNRIVSEYSKSIDALSTVGYCISLDDYSTAVPDTPYQIDCLYAARIEYEDGSVWEDPYGIYAVQ